MHILPSLFDKFVAKTYGIEKDILSRGILRKEFMEKVLEKIFLKIQKYVKTVPYEIGWEFIYKIPIYATKPPPLEVDEKKEKEKEKEIDFSKPQTVCRAFTEYWQCLGEKERIDLVKPTPPAVTSSLSKNNAQGTRRARTLPDYATTFFIQRSGRQYFLEHLFA